MAITARGRGDPHRVPITLYDNRTEQATTKRSDPLNDLIHPQSGDKVVAPSVGE